MDSIDLSLVGGARESRPSGAGENTELDVQLLGPVRLLVAGQPVPLTGPRPRRLLALLALHANAMVPMDRVVQTLWDDPPPGSARQQVYNVVGMVRRALGGRAVIERAGSGYQLTVDVRQIDAVRFQRGVEQADRAAEQGEFEQAVRLLAAALEEWHGPALADLEGDPFENAATLLLEQRLVALERLSGVLLRVGDAAEVVRRLTPLVIEHPFRESLRALLMKGLYRTGRQAEALAVFEEGRRLLSVELGVDPGPGLQEAYQHVLRGEAEPAELALAAGAGAGAAEVGAGTGSPRMRKPPCQLPADVRVLVGREGELAQLAELAERAAVAGAGGSGPVVVAAIDGMGGVGKSALVAHAAHVLRPRFPDGQLYIDLHGHTPGMDPVEPAAALRYFLQALGFPPQQVPDDVDMRASCLRDRLADTRTLLVLDNAASTAQVAALFPGTSGCMVMVTSRRKLAGLGDAHQISLDSLSEEVAIDLLRKAAEPMPVLDGHGAASDLVNVCGHLPLAIKIVAARLKHNGTLTARSLAMELREEDSRLGRLSDGERELTGVFDSSLKVLPEQGRRLYRLLGLVPGPDFDAYAAANLLGADLHSAGRLLQLLLDHNLLIQAGAGRYTFHDLLHAHARSLAAMDVRAPESLDRLLEYYLRTTWAANQHLATRFRPSGLGDARIGGTAPEFLNQNQAAAWVRAERANLLAATAARELGPDRMISLIRALSSHLMYDGMWSLAIGLHRKAAETAAERGDRLAEANALLEVGDVSERMGRFGTAVENFSHALTVYRELGDRLGEAHALALLGQVAYVRARFKRAIALTEQALAAYEEVGDRRGAARCFFRLGCILSFEGKNVLAADRIGRAIAAYRQLGDDRGEAACLLNYSRILNSLGDFDSVRPTLDRALALTRRFDLRTHVANVLQEIAMHQVRSGEYAEAAVNLDEALRTNLEVGFPLGEGYDYLLTGRIRFAAGDLDEALRLQSRALVLFRKIESIYEASGLEAIARIHHAKGDLKLAGELLGAAMALFKVRTIAMDIQAEVHEALAAVKYEAEGPESALAEYRTALDTAIRGGAPHARARALEGMARCEIRLGRYQSGLENLRQAIEAYRDMGAVELGPATAYLASLSQVGEPAAGSVART